MSTEILRPNANGDLTQLYQMPGSGQNWDKVSEVNADDDTSYVGATSTTSKDLYNLPNHSIGNGTINQITIFVRMKAVI